MTQKMTPAYRQYLLKEKQVTQKQIAQELDVSEMAVSYEINDIQKSHRIRQAIAKKIGLPVTKVFPEYYSQPPQRSTSKVAEAA